MFRLLLSDFLQLASSFKIFAYYSRQDLLESQFKSADKARKSQAANKIFNYTSARLSLPLFLN